MYMYCIPPCRSCFLLFPFFAECHVWRLLLHRSRVHPLSLSCSYSDHGHLNEAGFCLMYRRFPNSYSQTSFTRSPLTVVPPLFLFFFSLFSFLLLMVEY
ncbi:hypothetical protein ABB37_09750 [Leptomonas pyrrhocoris]|uniref:Uncharacterized protein n=1 Tax=Leptomonas pyrrhocoris TaxID=157538 RepID=A0A0N0DQQ4_LEPPY|nr:hypothetical protein ABB37_09750 [Leptomonas pyrrhocoris]KPA73618.1 hypothetical protein ABB37_09750 [Leptomonas pyrrhocoris]|eukprot:XP_015652057.1 hypothetical protein ABB37_09750 [Leptomonas pyrrhocoris]